MKKYGFKNEDLDFQFRDWENQMREKNSASEIKSYQQEIRRSIQAKAEKNGHLNTNRGKFSWPTKIAIGIGIIGIVFGAIVIVYQVIKNKKVKK